MWKRQKTSNLIQQLTLAFVITEIFLDTALGLSDKRLCADAECKRIISEGKGMINYHAGEEGMVSFRINSNIRVKSKSAGTDPSLWGIEVNGREGFAPKKMIRETKVFIKDKDLEHEVDIVKRDKPLPTPAQAPVMINSKILVETTTIPVMNNSEILAETTTNQVTNAPEILTETTTISAMKTSEILLEATTVEPSLTIYKNETTDNIVNVENQPSPTQAQYENSVVERTELPILIDSSLESGKENQQKLNTEYDDNDDDGRVGDYDDEDVEVEDDKNQKDSVGPILEEEENVPNGHINDTKRREALKSDALTIENVISAENPKQKAIDTNGGVTAEISSAENLQLESLNPKDPEEAAPAISLVSDNKLVEAFADVHVLNKTSEIAKNIEKKPTVTNSYSDLTDKSLTGSSDILKKGSNGSRTKVDSVIEASANADIAINAHQNVPKKTEGIKLDEEISLRDTNKEALPKGTVNENMVEKQISTPSSLPDDPINFDFSTDVTITVNSEEIIPHPENKFRVEAAQIKDGHNKPGQSTQANLPVENTSQFVAETDNVQVNPTQYSSLTTQTDSIHISTGSSSSQPSTQTDSHLNNETQTQTEHLESDASKNLQFDSEHQTDTQTRSHQSDLSDGNTNKYYNPYDCEESSNTPLPPQYDTNNNLHQTTDVPHQDFYGQQPAVYAPVHSEREVTTEIPVSASTHENSFINLPSNSKGSVETVQAPTKAYNQAEDPKPLPFLTQPVSLAELDKKEKGLFATIMDTVNNILPNSKKPKHVGYDAEDSHNELDRILYSNMATAQHKSEDEKFCEKLDPNNCPHSSKNTHHNSEEWECSLKNLITTEFTFDTFLQVLASKVLEISELIAFLVIVAATSLFFIFGYYCFCNSSSEGALLSKLNQLESSLLASHKENDILKHNLMSTRQKLASIEDNSFGSNDMVVSLKKELEEELLEKARLQEQIVTLQKELENAADAGIELNKIVSELLSNQSGDESIISSVEELQKQLNEQQNTILEINASLAEKSRENSELQLMIAEQNARYESQMSDLQQDNDELEAEKGNLQSRLEEIRTDFDKDITAALESKNFEIKRLQNEIVEMNDKVEAGYTKWQTSMAKVEALEECLKNVKRDPNVNITQVIDVANIRAELLDAQKKYNAIKERWELELDARKLAESQLKTATAEVEKIKQDFNQTEKDKLEAQTRLEVLSNYFKEKENQLQKELSLKETMWLKQRGETTTTVDRLTTMQEEIQSLKSQNDALRAEIEAQVAAHKAQTGTLENRAHETWLAARQSDRRYEEARAEATALRRKLTVLAGGSVNEVNKPTAGPAGLGDDLATAPSPIHLESPGSPMLGRMPPPPFLPPPFMGPPPPFMGMPPPPQFVPTGEMRPAPLGRIMSPPPPQRSGHVDYEDYLDYEGNNSWHRHHTYSPPPRTYRSLSPTDSRYNYDTERDLLSRYDTETDFSPPPSPRESRRRGGGGGYGSDKEDSNFRHPYPYNNSKNSSGNKAPISSGSEKSYNSPSKKVKKSKSGGGGGGGKFLV